MKSLTSRLHLSNQTVFTSKEITLLWEETNPNNLKNKINYYVKSGVLKSLRRGLYALVGKNYLPFEVANRIYSPSYISLHTILATEGVVFQYDSRIYSLSYQSRDLTVDGQGFIFRKINNSILTNPKGLINTGTYWIATKERAFLDSIYLDGEMYFDHLGTINWDICRELLPIYHNQALNNRFEKYARH
jgi:hypothetical protein